MYGEGPSYAPPFYDPSTPNTSAGMPAYVGRMVTMFLPDGSIGPVMTPIPCYYL